VVIHAVDLPVNNNVFLALMRPVFHLMKNRRWDKKAMTIAQSAILTDFLKAHV
jgi:rRNA pseudouridine-1189 N-methylase Emg1 (Nep1/Mra1 family)